MIRGAHVPVARAVCRKWHRLLANYCRYSLVPGTFLYPVRQAGANRLQWCGWDDATAQWRLLPPLMIKCYEDKDRDWQWMTSSRGLVLMRYDVVSYSICNPVTRTVRDLPRLPRGPMQAPDEYITITSEFNKQVDADGQTYIARAMGAWTDPVPRSDPLWTRQYPWLVTYRKGASEWNVVPTVGSDEQAAAFWPLGKPVVAGGELFMVGSIGRDHPGCIMALDLETKTWRVAGRGVKFTDTLVVSCGRILLLSEEEITHDLIMASDCKLIEDELSPARTRRKTFVIHWVGAAESDALGEVVLESRCDFRLYPEHPNICVPGMWSVVEFAGKVFITCGSAEEPTHHVGVVYYVASKVWRKWCGGHSWLDKNSELRVAPATRCFELGMITEP